MWAAAAHRSLTSPSAVGASVGVVGVGVVGVVGIGVVGMDAAAAAGFVDGTRLALGLGLDLGLRLTTLCFGSDLSTVLSS